MRLNRGGKRQMGGTDGAWGDRATQRGWGLTRGSEDHDGILRGGIAIRVRGSGGG